MKDLRTAARDLAKAVIMSPLNEGDLCGKAAVVLSLLGDDDTAAYTFHHEGSRLCICVQAVHAYQMAAFLAKGLTLKAIMILRREYFLSISQARTFVEQCKDGLIDDMRRESNRQQALALMGDTNAYGAQDAEDQEEVVIRRSYERPTRP